MKRPGSYDEWCDLCERFDEALDRQPPKLVVDVEREVSRAPIVRPCRRCGKLIPLTPPRTRRKFCSSECAEAAEDIAKVLDCYSFITTHTN